MKNSPNTAQIRNKKVWLENLYSKLNHQKFVHPDPIEFLYHYKNLKDREIVGLISSTLSYGRVEQILKSTSWVLNKIGKSPYDFLMLSSPKELETLSLGFKHRFTTAKDLAALLLGIKKALNQDGSLQKCFLKAYLKSEKNILSALSLFVHNLMHHYKNYGAHLLPLPERGSANKRLFMYLRWMVRQDAVDPGGWDDISPSSLIVPIDVHMHRMGLKLGFTQRKQANLKTALEITKAFQELEPNDPVKYDFSLTRIGILKLNNFNI